MKVLLIVIDPEHMETERLQEIKGLASDYEVLVTQDESAIRSHLGDVEIAAGMVRPSFLAEAEGLRWYQQYGAGADWLIDHPEIASRDFLLTNASGVHSVPITEHIMAFLLCFARGLKAPILGQNAKIWEENRSQPVFELEGKVAVVVGVGAIGGHFARIASAFGMEVVGVRRKAGDPVGGASRTVGVEKLDEELPKADFLVLTMPLTSETHHMIDARRIALLRPTSYLINIGRGATVDEKALVAALKARRIAGAGLDVFESEPLPSDSPLWELENVIITPHYSGLTPRYTERFTDIFIDNLRRYLDGTPLRNRVDFRRGY